MKIVKRKFEIYRTTCTNCGCVFEYKDEDICVLDKVFCPECNERLQHDISYGIKRVDEDLHI